LFTLAKHSKLAASQAEEKLTSSTKDASEPSNWFKACFMFWLQTQTIVKIMAVGCTVGRYRLLEWLVGGGCVSFE